MTRKACTVGRFIYYQVVSLVSTGIFGESVAELEEQDVCHFRESVE